MLNLYPLDAKLSIAMGAIDKQTPFMQRVLATKKGRLVIACSMITPVKFCNAPHKYIDDIYYVQINGDWLNPEQLENHRGSIQKEICHKNMINCGLTEDDLNITEEKLLQWEADENPKVKFGDRVEIISFTDLTLPSYGNRKGMRGRVEDVDESGMIWVNLDKGPVIGLDQKDRFKKITIDKRNR